MGRIRMPLQVMSDKILEEIGSSNFCLLEYTDRAGKDCKGHHDHLLQIDTFPNREGRIGKGIYHQGKSERKFELEVQGASTLGHLGFHLLDKNGVRIARKVIPVLQLHFGHGEVIGADMITPGSLFVARFGAIGGPKSQRGKLWERVKTSLDTIR